MSDYCHATVTRRKYTWTCYQPQGHDGPHRAGNSANKPIYMRWFDVIIGGRR
jgi:hypothetical protein